jgi:anti-anti-sigma factor
MIHHQLNHADKTLHLTIPGDLVSPHADSVRKEIVTVLESTAVKSAGWTTLELDLSSAKRVDSVGLNIIVFLSKEAKKVNAKTVVMFSDKNVQHTFLFTRLDTHIQVIMANKNASEMSAI